ncbi:MAG: cupin domain-containing protein [Sporocytophaga sp.]|uniref:cupin domain-containing protein n=1 Tax=Sporocytophaga sp. TaxID=2231183 RepID=UPI001B2BFEFC|nr:cupin domain-containing protein [Sporocytophaga sp.]MBO9702914.1 cupin domain-containing protein [Sporocytophaga sp.]
MTLTGTQTEIFPKGGKISAEHCIGNAWMKLLVPNDGMLHCQVGNVVFEPGARNNWHRHPGGQILIVTEGIGYFQERGQPIQIIKKGEVINIPPDVEHWHGASPESECTHIAITTNTQNGIVVWMERVTDEVYNQPANGN